MWLVAINPTSGRGKGATVGQLVTTYLRERSVEYRIVTGSNALALQENLRREISISTGVIAVGGDGLVHMVLQVVAKSGLPLVCIPAGTGNDFVRSLGWDVNQPLEPLWAALTESATSVDLGSVDGEYFGAIASTGFDSLVNERANKLTWPKGPSKYNFAIALELPKFKPLIYNFSFDGQIIQREAMLIAVGNGSSYGGGMKVCPNAKMNDGALDIMILNPVSKREFVKIFPSVYEGAHINHPAVESYRISEVVIDAKALCYADGERIGPMPAHITTAEGALLTWQR